MVSYRKFVSSSCNSSIFVCGMFEIFFNILCLWFVEVMVKKNSLALLQLKKNKTNKQRNVQWWRQSFLMRRTFLKTNDSNITRESSAVNFIEISFGWKPSETWTRTQVVVTTVFPQWCSLVAQFGFMAHDRANVSAGPHNANDQPTTDLLVIVSVFVYVPLCR